VGLPDIGLHTLRHSAAAVMLVNEVPLKVVSEVLGHASAASPAISTATSPRMCHATRSPVRRRRSGDKRWS
jgi:integrase